jgi:MoxR-like ATPase
MATKSQTATAEPEVEKEESVKTTRKTTTKTAPSGKESTGKRVVKRHRKPVINNLIAEVPDRSFYEEYVSRQIGNWTDLSIFDGAHLMEHNILIEGPTGSGKTSAVLAWAALHGRAFYSISSSSGLEPSQLFGKWIPDGNGGLVWQDGPVTDIVRYGGVLLVNEVNFIPERIQSVLFGLFDKRRKIELPDHKGEVIYAHEDFTAFIDFNPDYEGTRPLNTAFRNRFPSQLVFDYDPAVEEKLVYSDSLRSVAKQLRDQIAQGLYDTPVSTNMMIEFEQACYTLDLEYAIMSFVNHFAADDRPSVKGVFDTWTANLEADIANYIKHIDGEEVEADEEADINAEADSDFDVEGEWDYEEEAN